MRISLTTEPMPHQVEAVERIGGLKVGGLFMDMGTGKSMTAMMLAARRAEKIDRVWWGCPCSLREAVVEQIRTHSDVAYGGVVIMDGRTPDAAIEGAAWVVFGLESVGQSDAVTLKLARHVDERSMMVLDESTYIKGARAKRTDRVTKIAAVCRYRLVMSGTPLTQGLVDIYAQMRFLSPKILGYRSFWSFQQAHIEYRYEERQTDYGKRYKVRTNHIVGYRGGDTIVANVAPYVHQVRKDECLKLPEKVYDTLAFDMTEEQADEYERVKRELLLDRPIDDFFGSSSSIALFRLFSALQRVVAGIPPDVPHRRIETLMKWVRAVEADEPVVIWTKYHRCADSIEASLAEEFGDGVSAIYDGRVGDRGRQANLHRWRDREARFLLATQDSGGHGLTLVECANTAFYADGFKYSNRLQAEDRFHRIGQTRSPRMFSLICRNSIDERIAENHRTKGATLSAFRQGLDRGKRRDARGRLLDFVGGAKKSAGGLTPVEL